MDSARWQRIQELFHGAADLPLEKRRPYVESACEGDEALLGDVLGMLEEDSGGSSLLDRGVADAAQDVLAATALPFETIGRYRLRRLLGEGGMGVVYLAERDDLHNLVAIKILRDAWLSPARRERFAAEQRTLAGLNHPSIARLYDAGTLPGGTPWFAMEYVEGVPLTEHCARSGASVEDRLRLFRKVCEAVDHAHQHAVIHRDLKPSNILVRPDGEVRLLDFGIAKQLDAFDSVADQTRTGLRLMTPAYAAPEQIRGDPVGVYTDVYALGLVLYELLAGRLPLSRQDPERPTGVADLDVLCLTAMQQAPERRYASAGALIRDIDRYLKREPLEAQPDSWRYRAGKFIARHRPAVAAAVLAFLAVNGLVIYFTVKLAVARNVALAEAERAQRIQQFMQNLFQGGDAAAGPAGGLRVVTLLDRGVLQARELANEPAAQADLYATLGGIYQKLGKLDRADSLLQMALDQRRARAQQGSESASVAESLVALALLRIDQERLPEAEQLARQGLEMTRRTSPGGRAAIAKAETALGRVLEERGNYDQAVRVLDEAVRFGGGADSLNELAAAHFYAGRYAVAGTLFQRVLEMHRKLYGERHPLVGEDLINLGAVRTDLGYYAEAEKLDRQALEINLSYYGPEHPQTAHNLTVLGRALVYRKRFGEAVDPLRKALAIEERVYGPVSRQAASALNELGAAALAQGEFDEAAARFSRMVEIYRAVYNNHHYLIGTALSNLGSVAAARKQYGRAVPLYRQAIRMYSATLPPEHVSLGIAGIKLGHALLGLQNYDEAEREIRRGYAILSKQANPSMSYLQNARTDLATLEARRRTTQSDPK